MKAEEHRLRQELKYTKSSYESEIHSLQYDYFWENKKKTKRIEELELELGRLRRLLNKVKNEKGVQVNAMKEMEPVVETKVIKTRNEIFENLEKTSA